MPHALPAWGHDAQHTGHPRLPSAVAVAGQLLLRQKEALDQQQQQLEKRPFDKRARRRRKGHGHDAISMHRSVPVRHWSVVAHISVEENRVLIRRALTSIRSTLLTHLSVSH